MFKSYNNTIVLTRGDSAGFDINITDASGDPVSLDASTIVTFTVKASINDENALITKHGTEINILPEDTSSLAYGDYVYDVQLNYEDGTVETIITPSTFRITGEVTW